MSREPLIGVVSSKCLGRRWVQGLVFTKDPGESELYRWDFTGWLRGEVWANPPTITADPGITAAIHAVGDASIDMRVSGGTAGQTYLVAVRAESFQQRRIVNRTVRFLVRER